MKLINEADIDRRQVDSAAAVRHRPIVNVTILVVAPGAETKPTGWFSARTVSVFNALAGLAGLMAG